MVEDDEQLFANELVVEENGDSDSDNEVILNIVLNKKKLENRIPKI